MKMQFLKNIILPLFVIVMSLLVTSCEKEVEVDLRTADPRLVIEGLISENNTASIKLTSTIGFYEPNYYERITNAFVTLSDNAGNSETLTVNSDSIYYSSLITGVAGRTYTLTVEYDNQTFTSSSTMPPMVPLDSLSLRFLFSGMDYPFPYIHFTDPLGEENQYYLYQVYINGQRVIKDDTALSAQYYDGLPITLPITVFPENNEDEPYQKGDLITIKQLCVDKSVYLYFNSLANIDSSLNNPTTNITGGALGYFSAYSEHSLSIVANWD